MGKKEISEEKVKIRKKKKKFATNYGKKNKHRYTTKLYQKNWK